LANIAGTVAACAAAVAIPSGPTIVACVQQTLGAGHACYDCACYCVSHLTPWDC
jgi:hypothetical protein